MVKFFILFIALAAQAQAQIGWTLQQCRGKYHHEVKRDGWTYTFNISADEDLSVTMKDDGTGQEINSVNSLRWTRYNHQDFTAEAVQIRLHDAAPAAKWKRAPDNGGEEHWVGIERGADGKEQVFFEAYKELDENNNNILEILSKTL